MVIRHISLRSLYVRGPRIASCHGKLRSLCVRRLIGCNCLLGSARLSRRFETSRARRNQASNCQNSGPSVLLFDQNFGGPKGSLHRRFAGLLSFPLSDSDFLEEVVGRRVRRPGGSQARLSLATYAGLVGGAWCLPYRSRGLGRYFRLSSFSLRFFRRTASLLRACSSGLSRLKGVLLLFLLLV